MSSPDFRDPSTVPKPSNLQGGPSELIDRYKWSLHMAPINCWGEIGPLLLGALKYHAQNRLAPLKLMNSLESWGSGAWDHKFQWFGLNHWKREYHKAPAQDKAINAGLEIKRREVLHKFNMSNTGTWSFNNSGWITKSRGGKSQTVEFRGKHIYRIIAK